MSRINGQVIFYWLCGGAMQAALDGRYVVAIVSAVVGVVMVLLFPPRYSA